MSCVSSAGAPRTWPEFTARARRAIWNCMLKAVRLGVGLANWVSDSEKNGNRLYTDEVVDIVEDRARMFTGGLVVYILESRHT